MHYEQLVIDNFLCFKKFKIDFAPGVSVIIGRNGAGKTSLIRALVYSLYFMFTNDRSMGDDFLSAGNPDLKMHSLNYSEFHRDRSTDEPASDANFHGEMTHAAKHLVWDMYRRSTSGSSLYPSKYQQAYRDLMQTWKSGEKLPLIAYFSDSFPHNLTNISQFAKQQMSANGSTLRNFGYYQWDNDTACIEIWIRRLLNSMSKLNQLQESTDDFTKNEVAFVLHKLKDFSQVINRDVCDASFEIEKVFYLLDENERMQLWLKLKSGKEVCIDKLPAGYKRLYSMVIDLAYRSYLLTRSMDEPTGLVMIDEIDLHLHPSLEMEVVDRFSRTFPELQFIMTTHSPLVLSSIKSNDNRNKIYRIVAGEEEPHMLPDLFGVDYDDILTDYMESRSEIEMIEFLRTSIVRARKMNNDVLFNQRYEELKTLAGKERADELLKTWL